MSQNVGWSKWLPPAPTPRRDPPVFVLGEVYGYCDGSWSIVMQVAEARRSGASADMRILAKSGGYNGNTWCANATDSGARMVLLAAASGKMLFDSPEQAYGGVRSAAPLMETDAGWRWRLPKSCLRCGGSKNGNGYMDSACWNKDGDESHRWAAEWDKGARDFPRGAQIQAPTATPAPNPWQQFVPTEVLPKRQIAKGSFHVGEIYVMACDQKSRNVFKVLNSHAGGLTVEVLAYGENCPVSFRRQYFLHEQSAQGEHSRLLTKEEIAKVQLEAKVDAFVAKMRPIEGKRQVSLDGKSWADYDSMHDADAFEAYKRRRLVNAGKVVMEHGKDPEPVKLRAVGNYSTTGQCGWGGRPGAVIVTHCAYPRANAKSPYCEQHIAMAMREQDASRAAMRGPAKVEAPSPLANRRFLDGADQPWMLP